MKKAGYSFTIFFFIRFLSFKILPPSIPLYIIPDEIINLIVLERMKRKERGRKRDSLFVYKKRKNFQRESRMNIQHVRKRTIGNGGERHLNNTLHATALNSLTLWGG